MNKEQIEQLALELAAELGEAYSMFDKEFVLDPIQFATRFLARVDAERAKEQKPLQPRCYWMPEDCDTAYDCVDDGDIINAQFPDGAKLGDEYTLSEAHYFQAHFRIVKIPDDMSDDYEVERISGTDVYIRPQPIPEGWKEAAIAWEVCASIHREYAEGKDALFKTRQQDFVRHAKAAREAMLANNEETRK